MKREHPPPVFWDTLSRVQLTKASLKEFAKRIADHDLSAEPPRRLTAIYENAEQLAKNGGPNLDHLRGFSRRSDCRNNITSPGSSKVTGTPRSSYIYDHDFEQKLIDARIYEHPWDESVDGWERRGPRPKNLNGIRRYLKRRRASLSSSRFRDQDLKDFRACCRGSFRNLDVLIDVLPQIAGSRGGQFQRAAYVDFDNIAEFMPGVEGPRPDTYDGANPLKIHKSILHQLDKHIVPSTERTLPIAPNFFVEAKVGDIHYPVASRQACFNGAIGARAMHSLQNYGSQPLQYDGNAYTFCICYDNDKASMEIYVAFPSESESRPGCPEWHNTMIGDYKIYQEQGRFIEAVTAFRNARDLAKQYRDEFIEKANVMARYQAVVRQLSFSLENGIVLRTVRYTTYFLRSDRPE